MTTTHRWLVRTESFGALLHDRLNKESFYISLDELNSVMLGKRISVDGNLVDPSDMRLVNNREFPANAFSAPDGIYFELTRRCNLRCRHCFNSSGKKLGPEWSLADIERLFCRFYEIGVLSIRFTGGEPFCSEYLVDALALAKELGIATSIGTNGILITDSLVQDLADSDVSQVIVSVDGMRDLHDSIRGKGNFDRAVSSIRKLVFGGVNTRINVVATKGILGDVGDLIDLADELNVKLVIRRLIATGRSDSDQMLSPFEYAELNEFVRERRETSRIDIFSHYDFHKGKQPRVPVPFYSSKCSCGSRGIGILPNGDVVACGFLAPLGESFVAGNVHSDDIMDIWLHSKVLEGQRESAVNSFCRTGCPKRKRCKGSCPALLHSFDNKDPYCSVMSDG